MSKQGKGKHEQIMKILKKFDPKIAELIEARYYSGRKVYNGHTHKRRPEYVDEAQARAVLIGVRELGITLGSPTRFNRDELRRLNNYVPNGQEL